MESFYFGQSHEQLYGVFHSADPQKFRSRSILLLYPVGQEYMRIHRAYRRLADSLSERGFDVLRFDYACTGDSFGVFDDASVEAWVCSAETAFDELQSMSPESRIDVVALRFGTVICRELSRSRKLGRVVLWEPFVKDQDYFEELIADIGRKGPTRGNFLARDGKLHYNGFGYSRALRDETDGRGWQMGDLEGMEKALVLSTRDTADYAGIQALSTPECVVEVAQVDGPADWTVVDSVGGLFLPEPSLEAIRTWLTA